MSVLTTYLVVINALLVVANILVWIVARKRRRVSPFHLINLRLAKIEEEIRKLRSH